MMNPIELKMRRRVVAAFIKADPVQIILVRNGVSVKSAAGGYVKSPSTTLLSQQARIIPNKRRYNNGLVNSEAGDIPHTDYLLLGVHTLDAEANDTFIWRGSYYQITGIDMARAESFLASIDILGAENRG